MISSSKIIFVIFTLFFASINSFPLEQILQDETDDKNQLEETSKLVEKKSGAEVQNILSMIENAMNEAPNGSRPKQVRFSVVGKRNFDDLKDILKQIEFQLDDKSGQSNGNSVVPVRFSLTGKR